MTADQPLRLEAFIDGGARGNPGPAAAGVVLRTRDDKTVVHEQGIFLGRTTNNVAEYQGLLAALRAAANLHAAELHVYSDSELLVRQVNGQYRVRQPHLQVLHQQAAALARGVPKFTISHVRREHNTHADHLVNLALNAGRDVDGDA